MSPEARERIAAAQRRRWATQGATPGAEPAQLDLAQVVDAAAPAEAPTDQAPAPAAEVKDELVADGSAGEEKPAVPRRGRTPHKK